ncbi:NAD(P)H-quinone oxidoreductase [Pokkaliibacter sp. CJK22405]|uniref:NAD(P)H-quinone oxidoreductase n=1 Tax=Pokkaliibacter sp. CJK22405 TaxID=3384615 RepID=UPI003984948E
MSDVLMKAVEFRGAGGPEVIQLAQRPRPTPAANELLIRVEAAGVNRPDIFQREGAYPPPQGASDIPGLEIAGEVVSVGACTNRFTVGDKVCGLVAGGGYAEYCTLAEDNALPIPQGLTSIEAASLPETFFTVWTNVVERGQLKAEQTLLVHGGSSGIGVTAIMIGKHLGARVIVTAGSDEKCRYCESLGADLAINYRDNDFVEAVQGFTDGRGAEVILDMVAGDYTERNFKAAATEGRIVQIALLKGKPASLNLGLLMAKRLTLTGSTLRSRSVAEKATIARAVERTLWPSLGKTLLPQIHKIFPLEETAEAHRLMESGTHLGKIVLTVNSASL